MKHSAGIILTVAGALVAGAVGGTVINQGGSPQIAEAAPLVVTQSAAAAQADAPMTHMAAGTAKHAKRALAHPAAVTRPTILIGEAKRDDRGLLELELRAVRGQAAGSAALVGRDHVRVVIRAGAPVTDRAGRRIRLVEHDVVRIDGQLLAASSWPRNDEGDITPAVRASRITVLAPAPIDEAGDVANVDSGD